MLIISLIIDFFLSLSLSLSLFKQYIYLSKKLREFLCNNGDEN